MVNTPPTPISRNSDDSMHSIQFDSDIFYDGKSLTSLRKGSLERATTSYPGAGRDYIGGENTRPAKFKLGTRDSATEFDFTITRTASKRLDLRGGVASLVKGCLGGGLLCIHESYMVCGLWTALPVNAILGVIITYSMYPLTATASAAERNNYSAKDIMVLAQELTTSAQKMYTRLHVATLSYPELAEAVLDSGPWEKLRDYRRCFRHSVETLICIHAFGSCSVYQTMIARQIKQLIEGTDGLSNNWPTVRVYIAILLIPCLIITVFTSLKHLAPFSIIVAAFIALLCITTMGYSALAATTSPFKMPVYRSLDGLFELIGVSMFSMDGIVVTLAVENSLKDPRIFPLVLIIGMSIVISLVMIIGSFGYWGFGDKSLAPVTINYPWGAFSIQLKMFLCIMTYITFALNFWVSSSLVWYYALSRHDPNKYWIWERFYRMILVIITNIVALLVPSNAMFIGLLGSLCVSILGLIFPAFITLTVDWIELGPGKHNWRVLRAMFYIVLGLTLCFIGTYANIRELVIYLTDKNNHGGIRAY